MVWSACYGSLAASALMFANPFCCSIAELCTGLCIGPVIALISVVLSELFGTQAHVSALLQVLQL